MAVNNWQACAAPISWIHPKTNLGLVDKIKPGARMTRSGVITPPSCGRFSNVLEVCAQFNSASGQYIGIQLSTASGIHYSSSFADTTPAVFKTVFTSEVGSIEGMPFARVKLIVGARTEAPEKSGAVLGGVVERLWPSQAWYPLLQAGISSTKWLGKCLGFRRSGLSWSLQSTAMGDGGLPCSSQPVPLGNVLFVLNEREPFGAPSALLDCKPTFMGAMFYDAVPNLENWKQKGWGPLSGTA
jgi:hypothetical protein